MDGHVPVDRCSWMVTYLCADVHGWSRTCGPMCTKDFNFVLYIPMQFSVQICSRGVMLLLLHSVLLLNVILSQLFLQCYNTMYPSVILLTSELCHAMIVERVISESIVMVWTCGKNG